MPKQCLSVLSRASMPVLQPWPRRNQRCFCRAARAALKRPQRGSTTCLTPSSKRSLFVGTTPEASVSRSQFWCSTESLQMCFQRRHPLLPIAKVARGHSIIADQPVFDFVDPDQATKFIGFVSFTLANDHTVGLKEAQDFLRMARLCLENSRPTLSDNFLNQGQVMFERSFCCKDLQRSLLPGH